MARTLGERGLVGRVTRHGERVGEDLATKRLRRLREKDRLARERLGDRPLYVVSGPSTGLRAALRLSKGGFRRTLAGTLHRVARLNRGGRGPRLGRRRNRPRVQTRAGERTSRVVDHDHIARRVGRTERVRDGVLPPLSARNETKRFLPLARLRALRDGGR